ncbi:sensor domain-containing diguanylate cyclase [Desulfonema magnum]|uniref:diguanylate cyclase n=1 Tax=Desulfonema magnum TaxID=45655 RepID=A0A975BNB6_9BACT|nr:sensor domain-containing diguanylate cyclase [Desulfonema magnum]QTA88412.1 GGDEF and PAS domains-containing protein [Desulfonema magnum]
MKLSDLNEKDFLKDMVSLCPDSIIGVNRKGIIIIFNQAAEKLMGYKREHIINLAHITEIYNSMERARLIKKKLYSSEFGGKGQLEGFESEIVHRNGQKIPIRLSATLIFKHGQEVGSVGFFHDLTFRKQMEARLRELSITDSLSGLFNQRYFYSILTEEMLRSRENQCPLSLICFDIDNFKCCNDRLGHLEGDNIIRMVGHILRDTLRHKDTAFRYGGDEFMVLLPGTDLNNARFLAERIRKAFNSQCSFCSVWDKDTFSEQVTLSLGVAQFNPEEVTDTFVKRADLAMYEAKRASGDQTVEAGIQIGKYK